MKEERRHIGVYGILLKNGSLLLVKKARGPYKGKYDLPGGAPQHGEALNTALIREIVEETGIVVQDVSLYQNFSCLIDYTTDDKKEVALHHLGLVYLVTDFNDKAFDARIKCEDVDGCKWFPLEEIMEVDVSPFTWKVVQNIVG